MKLMNLTEVDKDEESVMGDGDITGGVELDASSDVEEEGEHPSVVGVEAEKADVIDGNECPVDLPCMLQGDDKTKLVTETMEDQSLAHLRDLADRKERGYYWDDGLLVNRKTDLFYGTVDRIVLPVARRRIVLEIAHEKSGHLGYRKVEKIIKRRFTWPLLSVDIRKHCTSCESCQKANKSGPRHVPMVERPVITEIFENISVDIVGPLPKGKGGAEYILTIMCLASHWPEAVPLRIITARAISEAMLLVFSRIGLPLEMLSDQGSQFTGKLAKEVCKLLQIKQVRITAYHPQTNGAIERFHGTLEGILAKATARGIDWVEQLRFALFAIRQMPYRSIGFSPFELIYGRNVRTPLDLLYEGWRNEDKQGLDVCSWVGIW